MMKVFTHLFTSCTYFVVVWGKVDENFLKVFHNETVFRYGAACEDEAENLM